jgi:hypothetical protein
MRRLLPLLLNAATALSLVLCVATVALWVRSYWVWGNVRVAVSHAGDDWVGWSAWDAMYCKGWVSATLSHSRRGADDLNREKLGLFADVRSNVRRAGNGPGIRHRGGPTPAVAFAGAPTTLGFGWRFGRPPLPSRGWSLIVVLPFWAVAGLLAAPPVAWEAARWRRRRRDRDRRARQLCVACGYDLRATLERCPECGRVPGLTP